MPPDDNGMVARQPLKQSSFVKAIPNTTKTDDLDPLLQSLDGSVSIDDQIQAFKDVKTLYLIKVSPNDSSLSNSQVSRDEPRASYVSQRAYSQKNPQMIRDIENAISSLLHPGMSRDDQDSPEKRHSSICESLKSLRERRLRESMESPRFGRDSGHSSVTKKNSVMLSKDLNDELELAYTGKLLFQTIVF